MANKTPTAIVVHQETELATEKAPFDWSPFLATAQRMMIVSDPDRVVAQQLERLLSAETVDDILSEDSGTRALGEFLDEPITVKCAWLSKSTYDGFPVYALIDTVEHGIVTCGAANVVGALMRMTSLHDELVAAGKSDRKSVV